MGNMMEELDTLASRPEQLASYTLRTQQLVLYKHLLHPLGDM